MNISGILLNTVKTSDPLAVVIGLVTVFVGLIAIILICRLTGYLCNLGAGAAQKQEQPVQKQAAAPAAAVPVTENRGELAAAISAAVAEELGTGVSGIRIVSIKKV